MDKKIAIISIVIVFIAGAGLGVLGHWYITDKIPMDRAIKQSQEEQAKLNSMMRSGQVVNVTPQDITVQVGSSGNEAVKEGDIITLTVDQWTAIQENMDFIKISGQEMDITKIFRPGMGITAMAEDNRALTIYYDADENVKHILKEEEMID